MKGMITSHYPNLRGKDWIRRIDKDDQAVLVDLMMKGGDYGKVGGHARARRANRDANGRFAPDLTEEKFLEMVERGLEQLDILRWAKINDIAYDVALDPNNRITHPTEASEHEFAIRYFEN